MVNAQLNLVRSSTRTAKVELPKLLYTIAGLGLLTITPLWWHPAIARSTNKLTATTAKKQVWLAQAFSTTSRDTDFNLLRVSPTLGDDSTGNGSQQAPLKTITQALRVAQPNTVILLAPGVYSAETGETFPLRLKPGVTIQGNRHLRGQNTVIKGGGTFLSPTFASQNIAILAVTQSGLTGVTVKNPNARGYGVWIESASPVVIDNTFTENTHDGVSITGNSAAIVRNNYFSQNGANGITIYGTSRPDVRENVFENTGFGISVAQTATPVIVGNQIRRNKDGIVVQAGARPILRSNLIEKNERDGIVAIAQSRPDLGTTTQPGGNVLRNNGRLDINAIASNQILPAFGNQLISDRTNGRVDLNGAMAEREPLVTQIASRSVMPAPRQMAKPAEKSGEVPGRRSFIASLPEVTMEPAIAAVRSANLPKAKISETESAASFPVPASLNQSRQGLARSIAATNPFRSQSAPSQAKAVSIPISVPAPELSFVSASPKAVRAARPVASRSFSRPVQVAPSAPVFISVLPASTSRPRSMAALPPNLRLSTSRRSLPTHRVTTQVVSLKTIEIPVPPPETTVMSRPPAIAPDQGTEVATANIPPSSLVAASNLLPVPSTDIPLGNSGGLPALALAQTRSEGSPPLPPTQITVVGLRYRVVVEAIDENEQSEVKTLVPGAFQTSSKGKAVLQVGAFGQRANADQMQQMLASQGLRAMVEQLE